MPDIGLIMDKSFAHDPQTKLESDNIACKMQRWQKIASCCARYVRYEVAAGVAKIAVLQDKNQTDSD